MGSSSYPDSSFIVSLVSRDSNSARASGCMARATEPLPFTPLHRIECRNALRNAVARGELDAADCRAAFRRIEDDLREGLLLHTPVEWTDVFRHADQLSEKHSARDGQRTIDLLHVAMALEYGAKTFLTFDRRQRNLAIAAGLKVKP
ncbi:MAG TPA: type II toxin-antitoxin system VapC family toxin [Chthoniobacteraceae bacterium]|nr:type II toxin-antitoxin system VapC family toxin [Chthoniobacteraceae bacterium]